MRSDRQGFRLAREQRTRLLAGDYRPLIFVDKPDCETGTIYVLSRSHPKPMDDGLGGTFTPPSEPTLWVRVTTVTRRKAGGWAVRFDVFDHRDPRRLVRATPPRYSPELRREDAKRKLGEDEIAAAAEQSFYTSDPRAALDPLDAPPKGWKSPDLQDLERKQAKLLNDAQRGRLSLGRQLDSLLADARSARADVRNRAKKIEREIELLKRDLDEGERAA